MAERRPLIARTFGVCLALPALLAANGVLAQAYGPGPTYQWAGETREFNRPRPEAYCGQTQGTTAPDVMTYDRNSRTEVMVGSGPGAATSVTGINRGSGSGFSVQGDLAQPGTPYVCTADNIKQQGYAITPRPDGGSQVSGYDGQTGRRFEVADGPGGMGPNFRSWDPMTRSGAEVVTDPDGHAYTRTFDGRRALYCTRARLGLGIGVNREGDGVGLEAGPVKAEVSAHGAGVGLNLGC
jgi:hypothetical protein